MKTLKFAHLDSAMRIVRDEDEEVSAAEQPMVMLTKPVTPPAQAGADARSKDDTVSLRG